MIQYKKNRQSLNQARRHGGHSGAVPPNDFLCPPQTRIVPPQARLVPRRNWQARCYWSAIWGQNTGYHPRIRGQQMFFCRFCNKHRLSLWPHPRIRENSRIFWEEDLLFFFFGLHLRSCGNSHVFRHKDQNLWKFAYCLERRLCFFFVFTSEFVEIRVKRFLRLVHTLKFK